MTQAPAVIDKPRFLERPDALEVSDLVSQHNLILEALKDESVLKRGVHYGNPINEKTGKPAFDKPTLFKPGAQKLAKLFHLRPRYEELGSLHRNDFIAYRYRCVLVHFPTGLEIGEGVGSCNSKEKKYKWEKEVWDIDNTLLKMAAKRALVESVLISTAASDVFTTDQDLTTKDWHRIINQRCALADQEFPREDGMTWADWSREQAKERWGIKESRSELDADQLEELNRLIEESISF